MVYFSATLWKWQIKCMMSVRSKSPPRGYVSQSNSRGLPHPSPPGVDVYRCIMWAIFPIREWRCQDIDQVLHEIILFCLSVFSSSEVLGKIISIRSKLPTAACWSLEEKRGNCEANLLYLTLCRNRLRYHRHHRQIIHSILDLLRR